MAFSLKRKTEDHLVTSGLEEALYACARCFFRAALRLRQLRVVDGRPRSARKGLQLLTSAMGKLRELLDKRRLSHKSSRHKRASGGAQETKSVASFKPSRAASRLRNLLAAPLPSVNNSSSTSPVPFSLPSIVSKARMLPARRAKPVSSSTLPPSCVRDQLPFQRQYHPVLTNNSRILLSVRPSRAPTSSSASTLSTSLKIPRWLASSCPLPPLKASALLCGPRQPSLHRLTSRSQS